VSKFRDVGNVPALRVSLATDTLQHKESRTGNRLVDLRLVRERSATITMTLENFSKANLQLLLQGTTTSVVSGSASNETFATGLVVGDIVALLHPFVSSVVVTDSAGSPAILVAGTDYTVDANSGMVTILNLGSYTQPFKAAYSYTETDYVQMFKEATKERFLRFAGLNTANSNKPVVVELYRVIFDPAQNLDLINDELAQFELEGSVLYDSTRDLDATLGGFGRIIEDF
jgi:hypothetical protein